MKFLILTCFLALSVNSVAGVLHDVTMADEQTISGQKLKLKGMGLREISVLGIIIRVYVGGLYVNDPKENCDAIVKSDKVRAVYMNFIHHVSKNELSESLEKGIEKNCEDKCAQLKPHEEEIKSLLPAMGSGDVLKIIFNSKGAEFQLNDKTLGRVESADFSKNLLAAFIGKNPPTANLKDGLCHQ